MSGLPCGGRPAIAAAAATRAPGALRPRRGVALAAVLLLASLVGGPTVPVLAGSDDTPRTDPGLRPAATTASVVTAGSRASGAVALTFDDGWNRAACSRVARTLRSRHARGTFFINGRYLKQAPDRWRRILRNMPVGNHTRSHPDLVRQSDSTIRGELLGNEAIHERVLGRPMLKVLRPPYGSYDTRVRRIAAELGYRRLVLWNVDTRDWSASATVGSVIARATGARPGSIILMHCARSVTADALPAIIRHYRSRGIGLIGLGKLLRS